MLQVGIVGLPNSGKSTLFNALLARQIAAVANYPNSKVVTPKILLYGSFGALP